MIKESFAEYRKAIHESLVCGLDGQCAAFAIAMCRGLGWPLVVLMKKGEIRHVAVKDTEGNLWDARGKVGGTEFGRPFKVMPPYDLVAISEQELKNLNPVADFEISSISSRAQIVWPELPWKPETLIERVRAFAKDLEDLSRKHGLWIYGCAPTELPTIAESAAGEKGYELGATLTGQHTVNGIHTIKRWLL